MKALLNSPRRLFALSLISVILTTQSGLPLLKFGLHGTAEAAVSTGPISYVHDDAGRLKAAIQPGSGEAAVYDYDQAGNVTAIRRQPSAQLDVLEVTPKRGDVGTKVTVLGTGFGATPGENTVRFNGTQATITEASPTRIVTTVPSGASSGTVTVAVGAGSATSVTAFQVGPTAPAIADVTPRVVAPGDSFTVTGSRLDPRPINNNVLVNGVFATVATAGSSSVTAATPPLTGSGPVQVETPGGVSAKADVFVAPAPVAPADVTVTGRVAVGGQYPAFALPAGKHALVVFDAVKGQRLSLKIGTTFQTAVSAVNASILGVDGKAMNPVAQTGVCSLSFPCGGAEERLIDTFSIPKSGTYTAFVSGVRGDPLVTLSLYQVPADANVVATRGGAAMTLATTVPGQDAQLSFAGAAGEFASFTLSGVTPASFGGYVSLEGPDGGTLVSQSYVSSSGGYLDRVTLPATGDYKLRFNALTPTPGSLTARVNAVGADVVRTIATNGTQVTFSTTAPGQNARLTFTGTAGTRLSLSSPNVSVNGVNGSIPYSILGPDGTPIVSNARLSNSDFLEPISIAASGTYTILVDPTGSDLVSSAWVRLYTVPADVTGTISIGGSASPNVTVPGQNASLTFDAVAGQRLGLSIPGPGPGRSLIFAGISVRGPDGGYLVNSSVGNALADTLVNWVVGTTGTHTLHVDPSLASIGSVTLSLIDASDVTIPVTVGGASVNVATSVTAQNAQVTFSGTAGQRVILKIDGLALSSTTHQYVDATLKRPDTGTLFANDNIGVPPGKRFSQVMTLPVTGTYTLLLDPRGNDLITAGTVRLFDVPADVTASVAPGGAAVTVSTSAVGQRARVTFSGAAGQRVSIKVDGVGLSSSTHGYLGAMLVESGTENWLASAEAYASSGGFLDVVTLPTTGTYAVVLYPLVEDLITSATVRVYDVPPDATSTTSLGSSVTPAVAVPGQNAVTTFTGTAGQRVVANVTAAALAPTNANALISVETASGDWVGAATLVNASTGPLVSVVLPSSGQYRLRFDPAAAATGSATFSLLDATDVVVQATAGGPAVTAATTIVGQNAAVRFTGTAGQRISFTVGGFTLSTTENQYVRAWLDGPVGQIGPTEQAYAAPGELFADTITLPTSGTYTINLDPVASDLMTGASVRIYDVPADTPTATAIGSSVSPSTTVPGQTRSYTFSGSANQKIAIAMSGLTLSPASEEVALLLYNPNGQVNRGLLLRSDYSGIILEAQLDATGQYRLVFDPLSRATGSATFSLWDASDVSAAASVDGAAVSIATTAPGQRARVTFSGTVGQRVVVRADGVTLSSTGYQAVAASILAPSGSELLPQYTSPKVAPDVYLSDVLILPETGTYEVFLDPFDTDVMSAATVRITTASTTAPIPTTIGATVTPNVATAGGFVTYTFNATEGQHLVVRASNVSLSPASATASLRLDGPDGPLLTTSIDNAANGVVIDAHTWTSGEYRLTFDPASVATGTAQLALIDASDVIVTPTIGGPPVSFATAIDGQNVQIRFNGTAGQRVGIKIEGATYTPGTTPYSEALLLGPGVSAYNWWSVPATPEVFFPDVVTLPGTGTFTLSVDPWYGELLSGASVQLFEVPADISSTTSIGGSIQSTITTPGQNATYTFAGTAGQRLVVDASDVAFTPGTGYATVHVMNPAGTFGTYTEVSSSTSGAIESYTLPQTGTYTLRFDPVGASTGSVRFTLHDAPEVTGTITPGGATTNVATTLPGQNARMTFDATAGQRISLSATGLALSTTTHNTVGLKIRSVDSGTVLASQQAGLSGGFLDVLTLQDAGAYEVVVDPTGYDLMSNLTLKLWNVPANLTGTTSVGSSVTPNITVPGQNASYTFTGTSGQRLLVSATGATGLGANGAATVRLIRPGGAVHATAGITQATSGDFIDSTLPVSGTWRLEFDPTGATSGSVTLGLRNAADVTATITNNGQAVTVTTTSNQNARVTFSGTAGQRIALDATTTASADISIRRPTSGTNPDPLAPTAARFFDVMTLADTGTHTIFVDPPGTAAGSTTLRLYNASDLTGSLTLNTANPGTTTNATSGPGQRTRVTFTTTAANQPVALRVTGLAGGNATVSLTGPGTATPAFPTTANVSPFFVDRTVLSVAGTYTLTVDPQGAWTGTAGYTLHAVPDRTQALTAVTTGAGTATNVTHLPGQVVKLTFTATAGQRMALAATGLAGTNAAVSISPTAGVTPAITETITTSPHFVDLRTIATAGSYTITVDPQGSFAGTVGYTLYRPAADATKTVTAAPPTSTTIATTVPGQNAKITFTGTSGRAYPIAFSGFATTLGSIRASVTGPGASTTQIVAPTTITSAGGSIKTPVLSASGTYTLVVDPVNAAYGGATVNFQATTTTAAAAARAAAPTSRVAPPADANLASTAPTAPTEPTLAPAPSADPALAPTAPADPVLAPAQAKQARDSVAGPATTLGALSRPRTAKALPLLRPGVGRVSLSGLVRDVKGAPLRGVTLRIDSSAVRSDRNGRFTLRRLTPGTKELVILGKTANRPGRSYGYFRYAVDLSGSEDQALPFTIWMTPLDTKHTVRIPKRITKPFLIKNPAVPGLMIRLAPGTVLRDSKGRQVREVSLTQVNRKRPPFPLPDRVIPPVYFTAQPGDTVIAEGKAQIIYPNRQKLAPGTRAQFWHYEPDENWYVYGYGTVTRDGRSLVPSKDTHVEDFLGAMAAPYGVDGPLCGQQPEMEEDGDPVALPRGEFNYSKTDLVVDDIIPITATRAHSYSLGGSRRPWGFGTTNPYDLFLQATVLNQQGRLVLPTGALITFSRTSPGTEEIGAVYMHTATKGPFYKSVLSFKDGGYDLRLRSGLVYRFGGDLRGGGLEAIRDRFGNEVKIIREAPTFVNQSMRNVSMVRSPNGRWIKFNYTGINVSSVEDNIGRRVTYEYNANSSLSRVTDAGGRVTNYVYHPTLTNRIERITDGNNVAFLINRYDAAGRIRTQTNADGTQTNFSYRMPADAAKSTNWTAADIDAGMAGLDVPENQTTPDCGATAYRPDNSPARIFEVLVSRANGTTRRLTTLPNGQSYRDTAAPGTAQEVSTYKPRADETGRVSAVIDHAGRRLETTFDDNGNPTRVRAIAGSREQLHDFVVSGAFDDVASVTDDRNRKLTYEYETNGAVKSVARGTTTDPQQKVTRYETNPDGQVTKVTDPLGNYLSYTYLHGNVIETKDEAGRTIRSFVDGVGRPTAQTDPLGRTSVTIHNNFNKIARSEDGLGNATVSIYDSRGNLRFVRDARQVGEPTPAQTEYVYDTADRLIERIDQLGKKDIYTYNNQGQISRVRDRRGIVTVFEYDNLGRTVFVGFGATGPVGSETYESTQRYVYDTQGRLLRVEDNANGNVAFTYNNLDQVLTETTPQGVVTYTYDTHGRRESMRLGTGPTVTYGYDADDRLETITRGSQTSQLTYDNADRPVTLTLPGGFRERYVYDAEGHLQAINYERGALALGNLNYAYDDAGRGRGLSGSFARSDLPEATTGVPVYDVANRLVSWQGRAFTYDDAGNLLSDGVRGYSWNARGQLVSVSGPGAASFAYDALGRRVGVTSGGQTTQLSYDGSTAIQERTGAATTDYLVGLGMDAVLSQTDASGTRALMSDAIGSVVATGDAGSGLLSGQLAYDPNGRPAAGNPAGVRVGFAGREHDASGLVYMRARYYDPSTTRFISPDPIGFAGGDTNLYRYVGGNPVDFSDPTGLCVKGFGLLCKAGSGLKDKAIDWGGSAAGWLKDNVIPFARDYVPGFGLGYNFGTMLRGGEVSASEYLFSILGAVPGGGTVARVGGRTLTRGGPEFFRGAKHGDPPSFLPRPNEFKVDPATGFARETHGVSVFDNPASVANKELVPHRVNQGTIPDELRVIQRGRDPHHYEIVPRPGANLTPDQFIACLSRIQCG